MSNEKETSQRVPQRLVTNLEVNFALYTRYHLGQSAKIGNISQGGVFIRSSELVPVGSALSLQFKIPGHPKMIQAKAEVKWVYRQPMTVSLNSSGMGVQFTEIAPEDLLAIQAYIQRESKV